MKTKVISRSDRNISYKIGDLRRNYMMKFGHDPEGYILGAQDYLDFCAEASIHMRQFGYVSYFEGLPVRVITLPRFIGIEIPVKDAHYNTLHSIDNNKNE